MLHNDSGIQNLTIVEAVTMVGSIQGLPAAPVEDPLAGLKELHGVIPESTTILSRRASSATPRSRLWSDVNLLWQATPLSG